jgi:hypothetical protein
MISESIIGAIAVALLTGAALTLSLNAAFQNLGMALGYSVPATLVLGVILLLLATEKIKLDKFSLGGRKPPQKDQVTEGE